jgi:hypothetical protein
MENGPELEYRYQTFTNNNNMNSEQKQISCTLQYALRKSQIINAGLKLVKHHVIAQFLARKKGYKVEGQTGITGTYPTQCHHDGEVLSL